MRFDRLLSSIINISLAFGLLIFSSNINADIYDGLTAYYPLDGDVIDTNGTAPEGSVFGATLTTGKNGNPNSAYEFDGIDDFISIPHFDAFNMNIDGFSFSFFIRVDSQQVGNTIVIMEKFHQTACFGFLTGWRLQQGISGTNLGFFYGDGPNLVTVIGPSTLDDQWHHVVGMTNNGQFSYYIDGQLDRTQDLTNYPIGNVTPLIIGKKACNNSQHFQGAIDEIRFYNRALTEEEITTLYNQGTSEPPVDPVPPIEPDPTTTSPEENTDLVIQSVSVDPVTGELTIKATLDSSSSAWGDINSNPDIRLTLEVNSNDGSDTVGIVSDSSVQLLTDETNNKLIFGDAIEPEICEIDDNDVHKHKHNKHKHRKHRKTFINKKHDVGKWW